MVVVILYDLFSHYINLGYVLQALKWWAQSHLAGVPTIICGFRNDHGFVHHVEEFATEELPLRASWDTNRCLSFLDSVLTSMKNLFEQEDLAPESVLLLSWMPGDRGVSYKISRNSEDRFLPHWYAKAFEN